MPYQTKKGFGKKHLFQYQGMSEQQQGSEPEGSHPDD